MSEYFIQIAYLAASVLFILGIKGLTRPEQARRGMQLAAVGMLLAVVGTLLNHQIINYTWIILGGILGSAIGAAMSIYMPMTAIPQRTAISHAFGAPGCDAGRHRRIPRPSRRDPERALENGGARISK